MADKVETIADFRAYERRQPRYTDHEELLYMLHELSRIISVHFDRVIPAAQADPLAMVGAHAHFPA